MSTPLNVVIIYLLKVQLLIAWSRDPNEEIWLVQVMWLLSKQEKKKTVRSGIRTHAYNSRLRPERSALDRSAILTCDSITTKYQYQVSKEKLFALYKQNCGPTWTKITSYFFINKPPSLACSKIHFSLSL